MTVDPFGPDFHKKRPMRAEKDFIWARLCGTAYQIMGDLIRKKRPLPLIVGISRISRHASKTNEQKSRRFAILNKMQCYVATRVPASRCG